MFETAETWRIVLKEQLSVKRIVGFACLWAWMTMMFYSVVPYSMAADIRSSLYSSLLFSIVALCVTILFASLAVRRGDSLASNRLMVGGATAAMLVGTILTLFADTTTLNGTLCLGFGSVLTGVGSGIMLLSWVEVVSWQGERVALVELAASSALAFAFGFLLSLIPVIVADVLTCCLVIACLALLAKCANTDIAQERAVDEADDTQRVGLSKNTAFLFGKALLGVLLVGVVAGFFDVFAGYKTYEVNDIYGIWLLASGLMCALIILFIAVFFHTDGVFYSYRVCMLMMCLGCLIMPFIKNNTNVGALVFGGYHGYAIVLCSLCIGVATSFRVGVLRAAGFGYVALYCGELIGSLFAHGINLPGVEVPDLALLTLVAVSFLFISHLFLFTETDLVQLGIGEVNLSRPAREKLGKLGVALPDQQRTGCAVVSAAADALTEQLMAQKQAADAAAAEAQAAAVDPTAVIVERYGLSPREADVLPLLIEGRTISRIQETLFISAGTVSTHIRHIYQKTGAANRQELIDLAQHISEEL